MSVWIHTPPQQHAPVFGSLRVRIRGELIKPPLRQESGHLSAATSTGSARENILSPSSGGRLAPKSGTSSIIEELLFEVLHHAPKGRFALYSLDVSPASECDNIAAQASTRNRASATSDTM